MLRRLPIAGSILLLGVLAAYVMLVPPGKAGGAHLDLVPLEIAGFRAVDLPVAQMVLDDLRPDAISTRVYQRPGFPGVWVVVIYFENARLGAHNPEICYRSQGFAVENVPDRKVPSALGDVPCRVFHARRAGRDELVHYFWYTSGRRALAEVKSFRDQMFFQGLKENRSFGVFVRVSTLAGDDAAAAEAVLAAFVTEIAAALPAAVPEED